MYVRKNTNTTYCPESITGDGACCCNCTHLMEIIHPVLGTVAWGCNVFNLSNVEPTIHHGQLCECHEYPNQFKRNEPIDEFNDLIIL
jgi:hypothetical protein